MRYKLISEKLNDIHNPEKTILLNRGLKDYKEYLNLTDNCLIDYHKLSNIDKVVQCFLNHIDNKSNIHIIVDSDADGYTSASILYQYIKQLDNSINVTYSIHSRKEHGLSKDIIIPENINLLIIPDAGTNDIEQCKVLKQKSIDIIVLDHHICDKKNPYAIIVNNQTCNYPNKNLSGVGIVYKFLQALDEETWNAYADDYLDLVALGNIADCMDLREYETKRLVDKGLSKIKNQLFKALINKQSYSIGNEINITNIQFYIVPLVNALIRAGDSDEKDLMFHAFIQTNEIFKYKKRGEIEEIDEDIYTRTARFCSNAKNRQNNSKDKSLIKIYEDIEKHGFDKNKIIFANVTNNLDESLTGVTAIKVAEHYGKPCLLLRKKKNEDDMYGGSGRNINNSPIESLKNLLDGLKIFDFVQGHDNAFGLSISKENITKAIELSNVKLKNVDFSKYFEVDFVLDYNDLTVGFIKDIDNLKSIYGTGIKEPYIVIKNIIITKEQIKLMGKELDTWKFISDDGYTIVKFKCNSKDIILNWYNSENDNDILINIVGTASINNYNGILTPQVIINDYEEVK